jgi:alpha-D-xyloside xylohydrolase
MKFTDGNWLMRDGVTASYPACAYSVKNDNNTLTVHAPCRRVGHRGDTLGGPLLTLRLSAPMPGIVKVAVEHFSGAPNSGPVFPLNDDASFAPKISVNDTHASLTSGALSACVSTGDHFGIDFLGNGTLLTRSDSRSIGYMDVAGEGCYTHGQLSLGVGESVFGFGERFTAFAKNGQVVQTWNKDGGTGCDQAYKSVPFYLTNRGYGVFVNHPGEVSFEVASEKVSQVQFSVPGQSIEYYVIYGPTLKDVIERYTALTGRPALPPAWSFGLWLTTSFTTNYDEATVTGIIEEMAARRLPLHVFHFDCFWMREFQWCDFE